ncbi:tRNA-queuosine alpha-mannosyltransferase domain-containing protein [Teredinibacter purpureus]|uniref:tRNA-queuosine alpha-mannosyltransferase domain-containing protein n=1 Tax=Teredinibacter purpureus TaxID=2731756 RepID=UPI0005F7BEAD|nr:DUF3524 domain-containing protein [Teredinibacter purpureus]
MKILLLSAYDAESHRRWRHGLVANLDHHHWTVLHLPARHFNWRVRGNSLSWGRGEQECLSQPFDLIVATSMVDLSTLKGLVPALATTPTILYFHENQFSYPLTAHQKYVMEPRMVSLYSGLAANKIVFNSDYNRLTFLDGVAELLKKMPDAVPAGIVEELKTKSRVISVPLEQELFQKTPLIKPNTLTIVWNHRWEYDKGPDKLLGVLQALPEDVSITCHIVGQQFRRVPDTFDVIHNLLKSRGWLGAWGFVADPAAYRTLLAQSHVVLSTALHDFQGLSVLDGVAAGCIPLVPDRLAYTELFDSAYRYYSDFSHHNPDTHVASMAESKDCAQRIMAWALAVSAGEPLPPVMALSTMQWQSLSAEYEKVFNDTVGAVVL